MRSPSSCGASSKPVVTLSGAGGPTDPSAVLTTNTSWDDRASTGTSGPIVRAGTTNRAFGPTLLSRLTVLAIPLGSTTATTAAVVSVTTAVPPATVSASESRAAPTATGVPGFPCLTGTTWPRAGTATHSVPSASMATGPR